MKILKIGSKGEGVFNLTKKLKSLGLLEKATTDFDTTVRRAVKVFQSRMIDPRGKPLEVDGIVGPLTFWALDQTDCTDLFDKMVVTDFLKMPPVESGGSRIGREALKVAIEEMAKGAGEQGGNNMGPFVAKYHRVTVDKANQKKWAWCAAFVSFCFHKGANNSGLKMPFRYTGGAQNILNQAKGNEFAHVFRTGEEDAQPGDVIVWKRGSQAWQGHVGIVYDTNEGILHTIEGNRGPYPSRVAPFDYVASRMDTLLGVIRFKDE